MKGPFDILEITTAFARQNASMPASTPHRHEYEELLILTEGHPIHYIDFKKEVLSAPCFVYVPQGKIHQLHADSETRGWLIRYQNEFIPESPFHFYSHFLDYSNFSLQANDCLKRYELICSMMVGEYIQPEPDFAVIRQLLNSLIAMIESERKRNQQAESGVGKTQLISFNNFLKILEQNFRRPEGVQFYADKMNTSVRNLNLICAGIFNKSVSEIIETRKLIEAKQLLLNSEKSISEIGYELGYNEKSYFTRVFHKKTGLTPSEFKSKLQPLLA